MLTAFANAYEKKIIKLIIAGIGTNEQKMKEFVQKRNIKGKIIFCGFRKDVAKILSAFDIFVIPSFREGFPAALLEAMSCNRAIICSNIPPHLELIEHEKEGLIIDPDKPDEIKQAIDLLCKSDLLREKLGNNAKIKANQFDEELVFPKIHEIYKKLTF